MLPAYAAVKQEWREASMVLGGTSRDFWRRVGIPVLAPAIVSGFILMFASGMGAYATAAALVGQFNLMTLQIQRLRAGEVILGGSFTRILWVRRGDQFVADYGPLGTLEFRFD